MASRGVEWLSELSGVDYLLLACENSTLKARHGTSLVAFHEMVHRVVSGEAPETLDLSKSQAEQCDVLEVTAAQFVSTAIAMALAQDDIHRVRSTIAEALQIALRLPQFVLYQAKLANRSGQPSSGSGHSSS